MTRKVPNPIARQLRQEAGFGCCVCGSPIIQYHHILEWSVEKHFRPADMMVLCPLHHDQATKGAMPEKEQREFKGNPQNIRDGFAKGKLAVRQDYCAANFGTVTVVGEGPFVRIGNEDILGFSLNDGGLEISLRLFNQLDEKLLEIDKNEWVSGDPLPWDIRSDWQELTLQERSRDIAVSLDARKVPMEVRAKLWRFGKQVILGSDGIAVGGKSGATFRELALVGTVIEVKMEQEGFSLGPPRDHPEAVLISWSNRRERLWKAKEAWGKIKQSRMRNVQGDRLLE